MGLGTTCETTGPSGQYWCSLKPGHLGNHKAYEDHDPVGGELLEEWVQKQPARKGEELEDLIRLIDDGFKAMRERIEELEKENSTLREFVAQLEDQLISEMARASRNEEDLEYIKATEEAEGY